VTDLVKVAATDEEQLAEASNEHVVQLSGNAALEIFPFVTIFHREVVLRHLDGESQDIEMTPDEADHVADLIKQAAAAARALQDDSSNVRDP
jgi:hypothetical protein